jgi:short-subunit dehydrogenase
MASRTDRTLIIIGSGPGIARSVASLFAQKRHNKIALIARRSESLKEEQKAVQDAAGTQVTVKTYATDISDIPALQTTLNAIEADLGAPEVILFNAARVVYQQILEHPVEEIDLDWKVMSPTSSHTQKPQVTDVCRSRILPCT